MWAIKNQQDLANGYKGLAFMQEGVKLWRQHLVLVQLQN